MGGGWKTVQWNSAMSSVPSIHFSHCKIAANAIATTRPQKAPAYLNPNATVYAPEAMKYVVDRGATLSTNMWSPFHAAMTKNIYWTTVSVTVILVWLTQGRFPSLGYV